MDNAVNSPSADRSPHVPGYELFGILGRGGMGAVYRARQIKADRIVALKMPFAGANPELRIRFRTEAKVIARFQHPNIVQVFEVGETDQGPYMALEFCPGGSVADRLDGTPFPPRAAAELLETIARAVAAAHVAGIVHRDLKPANILLGKDGEADPGSSFILHPSSFHPKVADFGLARLLDTGEGYTLSGAVMGTPSYMAPEQTRGDSKLVGPAADVYALGSILYELLTGRSPFRGTTPLDTMEMVCTQEPVAPTRLQPQLPRDLETIALKCLRKEPENRYSSAEAFADDLRRFLDGRPIQARPIGWPERLVKRARRNPLPTALLALLFVVVVSGVGWGAWKQVRLTAERDRARGHFQMSMQAIEELLTEVGENDLASEPRTEQTRRRLLEKALKFYEELLTRETDNSTLRWELARATRRVGDIHRLLGGNPEALEAYTRALERLEHLRVSGFDPPERRSEVAHCSNWRGEIYRLSDKTDEADADYKESIAIRTALAADDPRHSLELAQTLYNRGILAGTSGRFADAKSFFADARRALESAPEKSPEHRRQSARIELNLADVLIKENKPAEAAVAAGLAVDLFRALVKEFPARHEFQHELAVSLLNLVVARAGLDDVVTAVPAAREARQLLEGLVRDFKYIAAYRVALAKTCTAQAVVESSPTDPDRSRQHTRAAIGHLEALIADQPGVPSHHGDLGYAFGNLGRLTDDPAEARGHFAKGIKELLAALRIKSDQKELRAELVLQIHSLADRFVRAGEDGAARQFAVEISRSFPDGSQGTYWAACFLARCAATVHGKDAPTTGFTNTAGAGSIPDRRANEFAQTALELIRAGSAANLAPLLEEPEFDPFRRFPQFRAALGHP